MPTTVPTVPTMPTVPTVPKVPTHGLPEPTVDVTLPETTYARLVVAKTAMNAASIEKTVERLATW